MKYRKRIDYKRRQQRRNMITSILVSILIICVAIGIGFCVRYYFTIQKDTIEIEETYTIPDMVKEETVIQDMEKSR